MACQLRRHRCSSRPSAPLLPFHWQRRLPLRKASESLPKQHRRVHPPLATLPPSHWTARLPLHRLDQPSRRGEAGGKPSRHSPAACQSKIPASRLALSPFPRQSPVTVDPRVAAHARRRSPSRRPGTGPTPPFPPLRSPGNPQHRQPDGGPLGGGLYFHPAPGRGSPHRTVPPGTGGEPRRGGEAGAGVCMPVTNRLSPAGKRPAQRTSELALEEMRKEKAGGFCGRGHPKKNSSQHRYRHLPELGGERGAGSRRGGGQGTALAAEIRRGQVLGQLQRQGQLWRGGGITATSAPGNSGHGESAGTQKNTSGGGGSGI